jgi:hypothetical protein
MMFKTVSLPADTWAKIVRRLTAEVGADDESRRWADMLTEQITGLVSVKALRSGSVSLKAGKGGDLRDFLGIK